ncbi:MAG: nucleotidyltransferase family protein [Bryobacterales bacterium]|nr:nucleotidyltransferase family protein [Bryobacterales bacterium]
MPTQAVTIGEGAALGECPALLLAAGESRRMGTVKALLPLADGVPAVCHLAKLYEQFCDSCVVVTGYHAAAVEAALAEGRCGRAVRNPEPQRGQLSSLQCGLRALSQMGPAPEWFYFAPVDCFDVSAGALNALRIAQRQATAETLFCIPEYGGRHGHPVAARWALAAEFLALGEGETARTVVRRHACRSVYVPMLDGATLIDYDTPAAFGARGRRSTEKDEMPC